MDRGQGSVRHRNSCWLGDSKHFGSSYRIIVEDKERAAESMPPPSVRKEIVLALRAPSAVPVAQPKGRKKKFTKHGDGESSKQGGSSIGSGLRGKVCRSLNFFFL